MSYDDYDDLERGGSCNTCGEPVEEDHHAYCADCYRAEMGWDDEPAQPWRKPRPAPGTEPESFVVGLAQAREGLAQVRERLASLERVVSQAFAELEERVDRLEALEHRRAA